MSRGGPWVGQSEVLTSNDAMQLFACFLAGKALPPEYALRDPSVEKVVAPLEGPDRPEAAADPVLTDSADDDQTSTLRWLAATYPDNRFGIGGYDCAAYVGSRVSMTADSDIARSFVERRSSTGKELDGQLPEGAVAMDCTLTYAMPIALAEGPIFRAAEMEDKWDVYRHGERLTFCRSWTGSLVFVAGLALGKETLTVRRVWAGSELTDTDAGLALRHFDYLLRSHVLRRAAPQPLPADMPDEAQAIAEYSFNVYGRNCSFASFGDTIAAPDFESRAEAFP
jgi:hypothetical protein